MLYADHTELHSGELAEPAAAPPGTQFLIKEFETLHDEVTSSFSKAEQQRLQLQCKVQNTLQEAEALALENRDKQVRLLEMEATLAREGDQVQRLRAEHAAIELKNSTLVDNGAPPPRRSNRRRARLRPRCRSRARGSHRRGAEKQLAEKREKDKDEFLRRLSTSNKRVFGARAAIRQVNDAPGLIEELRALLATLEEERLGKLVHNDSYDMMRAGQNLHLFDDTQHAFEMVSQRLEPPVGA